MGSQGTIGAASSASRKGPLVKSDMLLGDFFQAALKANKEGDGNSLVVKRKLRAEKMPGLQGNPPTEKKSVRLTDMGSGILSSWIICFVAQLVARRSWKGSINLNHFALLDGSVYAVVIPNPGNSNDRWSDGKEFARHLKALFQYENELPPYMGHLIYLLERIPSGPLMEEYKLRLTAHCTQMTSKGRVNLAALLKSLRDGLVVTAPFDTAVNKATVKTGWYKVVEVTRVLRKVAFYKRLLADFENLRILPPIQNTQMGAFDYIRNHAMHIENHMKELGLVFDDDSELLIPDAFGNFLAELLDHLLRSTDLSKRVAEIAKSCLPSPILVGVLPSNKMAPSVEVPIGTRIQRLQQKLMESQVLVHKLKDELADAQRMSVLTDQSTESASKIRVNISVIGHIRSGKSTTAGHLIYKLKGIKESEMHRIESEAIENNKQSWKYAWILDKSKTERENSTTMEIHLGKFETPKYCCTLVDSPGDPAYITNMISGTSQSDCAMLIIDSTTGSFEAGMSIHGQTREHAVLASTFGVKQLICCCNKIDATWPPYSSDRYNQIVTEVSVYLHKFGFKTEDIPFIPISSFNGDNLVERSDNTAWYKGKTLFEALNEIVEPVRPAGKALRLPLRGGYLIPESDTVAVAGCIVTGSLKPKMFVKIGPTNKIRMLKSLQMESDKMPLEEALPGDNVTLCFSAQDVTPEELSSGYVLSGSEDEPVMEVTSFKARVIIVNYVGEITNGFTAMLHSHTACVDVKFDELVAKLSKRGVVIEKGPKSLKKGDIALVKMVLAKPIVLDSAYSALARFVAFDNGHVVASGCYQGCGDEDVADMTKDKNDAQKH